MKECAITKKRFKGLSPGPFTTIFRTLTHIFSKLDHFIEMQINVYNYKTVYLSKSQTDQVRFSNCPRNNFLCRKLLCPLEINGSKK